MNTISIFTIMNYCNSIDRESIRTFNASGYQQTKGWDLKKLSIQSRASLNVKATRHIKKGEQILIFIE